jgi:hypothetical protein
MVHRLRESLMDGWGGEEMAGPARAADCDAWSSACQEYNQNAVSTPPLALMGFAVPARETALYPASYPCFHNSPQTLSSELDLILSLVRLPIPSLSQLLPTLYRLSRKRGRASGLATEAREMTTAAQVAKVGLGMGMRATAQRAHGRPCGIPATAHHPGADPWAAAT